jgi:general secretion pathway protein M
VIWFGAAAPLIFGFRDRDLERRQLIASSARNERLIAALPAWRAAAAADSRTAALFAILAPNEGLASEDLKEHLQRLAADQGFAIKAVQDQQADAGPGYVRLRMEATLTLTQFYAALRRLERESPYVVVNYLSISADRALVSGHAEPLDVRLEISAPWRAPRARSS